MDSNKTVNTIAQGSETPLARKRAVFHSIPDQLSNQRPHNQRRQVLSPLSIVKFEADRANPFLRLYSTDLSDAVLNQWCSVLEVFSF